MYGPYRPFWAVIGGFLGVVITMIANPVLHHYGVLSNWQPQMDVIDTIFINSIDFYLSFGVGLTVAITLVSLAPILKPLLTALRRSPPGNTDATSNRARRPACATMK